MENNLACQDILGEELIDGKAVAMSPRPAWRHHAIAGNIYNIFFNFLRGKKCVPIMDGCDLFLTEKDRFVPDMMVVCDRSKIRMDGVHGAPDLVVEVLSPSTARRDRGYKMMRYSQCGVREYWIVNPVEQSVEVYLSDNHQLVFHDAYAVYPDWELERMTGEERAAVPVSFRCSLFSGLEIALSDIFYSFLQ